MRIYSYTPPCGYNGSFTNRIMQSALRAHAILLQYLQATDGEAKALGITPSNRRQVERFIASASIKAGDMVCLDITKSDLGEQGLYITAANRTSGDTIVAIGFALEDADADNELQILNLSGNSPRILPIILTRQSTAK